MRKLFIVDRRQDTEIFRKLQHKLGQWAEPGHEGAREKRGSKKSSWEPRALSRRIRQSGWKTEACRRDATLRNRAG